MRAIAGYNSRMDLLLEADQSRENAVYSETFRRAIAADPNAKTRRRVAEIDTKWNEEAHRACYWGEMRR
jgi:hypothetical protein